MFEHSKRTHSLSVYASLASCLVLVTVAATSLPQPFKTLNAQEVQQQQETFFESAIRMANETAGNQQQQQQPAQQQDDTTDPPLNNNFVWQGQISSEPFPLREGEETQSVVILPIRDDEAMYSGILTYQSSKPVDAIVLNLLKPGNTTAIPEEFGDLDDIVTLNGELVSISEIGSGSSGSVPFTGTAIGLISDEEEPFLATYTVNGVPTQGRIINDITSLLNFNATTTSPEETEEVEEGTEEGE